MNKYGINWTVARDAFHKHSKLHGWDQAIDAIIDAYLAKQEDPYAHLKAAAADPTKQVRCYSGLWFDAGSCEWQWSDPPENYEIRDKPKPKLKKVKLLAWWNNNSGYMSWRVVGAGLGEWEGWRRVPSEDRIAEVEE